MLYVIGQIVKSQGLKGEVKVKVETDFPETFKTRTKLYLGKDESSVKSIVIITARVHEGFAYLLLEGVSDRTASDKLKNYFLFTDDQSLVPMTGDKAYIHDLIGLAVFDASGAGLGTLTDVLQLPAGDVYEITTHGNARKVLIPAIDEFIAETNLTAKKIVVVRFREFLDDDAIAESPDENL
ncbi:MAG: 16S rRNA processing protein RimM [Rhizobacter sp.]|nr:16S rRNA processing protein RimM [Chlorobiales bacterium]